MLFVKKSQIKNVFEFIDYPNSWLSSLKKLIGLIFILSLVACAGDSGEGNSSTNNPNAGGANVSTTYQGPVAQTSEIQNFRTFFWDPITGQGNESDKCSTCHGENGDAPSKFARTDDVNLAFSVAASGNAANGNDLVNLNTPENSEVVIRVSNGHNCWSSDIDFCRTQMIAYIEAWRDGAAPTATSVQLTAPELQDPAGSKDFPETSTEFAQTLWPVLNSAVDSTTSISHCQGCHSDNAPLVDRQTPYFASDDADLAYEVAKAKIDLVTPENSRFVEKVLEEQHNCWSDCADDAADILREIENLSNPIPITNIDPDLVTSKALSLFQDGIVAASGGRIEDDVIALYEFTLGEGITAVDRSNVAPAADLTLSGDYEWLSAWGVQFSGGKAQASVASSQKFHDILTATGEYSIEAWVAPANVTQEGPARIVSYSGGNEHNFLIGQTLYNYNVAGRSSSTDAQGMPLLSTADADEDLQATLQHIVINYDPINGRQIFVNGVFTDDDDPALPGDLTNWNNSYPLVLGSNVDGSNAWSGAIRLLAIHSRALSQESIQANFDAGVGQKYFLLFSISHLLDTTTDAFIIFEVSQFDNHAYLFNQPYFLSLDSEVVPETFAIEGMRIGINGKLARAGQAFATLNTQVDAANYNSTDGQVLSNVGTVIALENGPSLDQFFLVFDRLGDHTEVLIEAEPPDPVFTGNGEEPSNLAVRNFAEINHSFAQITGVSPSQTNVAATYNTVVQQLPSSEAMEGFLSSHQMGVTQLAISYCDVLVDDAGLSSAMGLSLSGTDANAKSPAEWDSEFILPMITAALNTDLGEQPIAAETQAIIHHLLFTDADNIAEIDPVNNPDPHGLSRCGGSCPPGQIENAAKAACAAILGSAAVTFH